MVCSSLVMVRSPEIPDSEVDMYECNDNILVTLRVAKYTLLTSIPHIHCTLPLIC
jgi:hypothetical protein